MEEVFTNIYKINKWGNNKNENYSGSSGRGSGIGYNEKYIIFLKKFINDYNIESVIDLGCGDFQIGRMLYDDMNIIYNGYDVYKEVIDYNIKTHPEEKYTFKHFDFYSNKENIEEGDLCILKDVLCHWTTPQIYLFMDYLTQSKKFKYILIINDCEQHKHNTNIETGGFRKLSCNYLPLKKYRPVKLYNYNIKEISIIKLIN